MSALSPNDRAPHAAAALEESRARTAAKRARAALDWVLSASAGVVAVSALAVSVYQAKLARDQQRASVWPRLEFGRTVGDTVFLEYIRNVGLGPALVRSVVVTVDGRPARTYEAVVDALLDTARQRAASEDTAARPKLQVEGFRRGAVLLPGATVDRLRFTAVGSYARDMFKAAWDRKLVTVVCYCSLYGDCWTVGGGPDDTADPTPVRACPARPDTTHEYGG